MLHFNDVEKKELSRQRVELGDGMLCDYVEYDIDHYGHASYAENLEIGNGAFRRARSMMPFEFLNARAKDFDQSLYGVDISRVMSRANGFILNFDKFRENGWGLYIHSKARKSGKTYLACCLANEVAEREGVCIKFTPVWEFLEMAKKKYRNPDDQADMSGIYDAELLVLDDIGAGKRKEWSDDELVKLVDSRCAKKRVTIFTSNVKIDELDIEPRVREQIYQISIPLELPAVPIGRSKADKEKSDFITQLENSQTR